MSIKESIAMMKIKSLLPEASTEFLKEVLVVLQKELESRKDK